MTSGPITEVGFSFVNVQGNKADSVATSSDNHDSFAKTLQNISGGQSNANQQSTMNINQNAQKTNQTDTNDTVKKTDTGKADQTVKEKTTTDEKDSVKDDTNNQVSDTKETTIQDKVENSKETVEADVKDAIVDAAENMIKNVADELDVSEDDVKAAMETLGLQMIDILNPEQLNQIVVEVSGKDMMNLVTDENLYSDLQNLTNELKMTLQDLSQDLGLSEDEIQNLLEQVKDTMTKEDTPVTVIQPVTPEEMSKTEDVPFLVKQESANIIDFRKNDSEQTNDKKVDIQNMETQNTTTEEKMNVTDSQKTDDHEDTKDHTSQEQSQEGMNSFQNKLDNAAPVEEVAKDPIPQMPDTESILKQISDYMKTKISDDLTEMEMQLHPASLGTVNLQIASKAGAITAQFAVQNEEVKQAMESQIVQLKENLEEQGVKIEAVEVTLASHSFEKNSGEQSQGQNESYEEEKNRIKPARRRILNLNDYTDLDDIAEVEDDAARIAMEMMAGSGNTLDMMA